MKREGKHIYVYSSKHLMITTRMAFQTHLIVKTKTKTNWICAFILSFFLSSFLPFLSTFVPSFFFSSFHLFPPFSNISLLLGLFFAFSLPCTLAHSNTHAHTNTDLNFGEYFTEKSNLCFRNKKYMQSFQMNGLFCA